MNILLISPLLTDRKPVVPNMGLAYIGAVLIKEGHDVSMIDIEAYKFSKDEVKHKILESNADIICMGTLVTGFNYVAWLCNMIKTIKPGVPIIIGNSLATTIPEIALKNLKVDYLVIGEGEITIVELVNAIEKNTPKSDVAGIGYMENNKVIITKERQLIEDIDTIPFPAWHLVPLEEVYFKNKIRRSLLKAPVGFVSTVRGCPFKCTYCYHPFQNKKIRMHSPQRIVDEIKFMIERYKIKSFGLSDDLFFVKKKKVYEMLDLLDKENIKIKWKATCRASLIDEELMVRIKAAGCVELGIGIESGSQTILNNIKKETTVETAQKALALCKKHKIKAITSYMIGNVGETRDTVFETINFRKKHDPSLSGFFYTTPYPGTELYSYALENKLFDDELELVKAYGEQGNQLLVNLTDMKDAELKSLRSEADKILWMHYLKKFPVRGGYEIATAKLKKILGRK